MTRSWWWPCDVAPVQGERLSTYCWRARIHKSAIHAEVPDRAIWDESQRFWWAIKDSLPIDEIVLGPGESAEVKIEIEAWMAPDATPTAPLSFTIGSIPTAPPAPPEPVKKPLKEIDLTGKLFPIDKERADGAIMPCFLRVPGSAHLYLPCFSTEAGLRRAMARVKVSFKKIKHIDDGRVFLDELPRSIQGEQIRVMLDPYWLESGRIRWTEIKWN